MKLLFEIIISLILHPIAVILSWINLIDREDMPTVQKFLWGIVCLVWGIGPILYILLAKGKFW